MLVNVTGRLLASQSRRYSPKYLVLPTSGSIIPVVLCIFVFSICMCRKANYTYIKKRYLHSQSGCSCVAQLVLSSASSVIGTLDRFPQNRALLMRSPQTCKSHLQCRAGHSGIFFIQTPTAEDLEVLSLVLCCCKESCQFIGAKGADEKVAEVRADLEEVLPGAPNISSVQFWVLQGSDVAAAAHWRREPLGTALHLTHALPYCLCLLSSCDLEQDGLCVLCGGTNKWFCGC